MDMNILIFLSHCWYTMWGMEACFFHICRIYLFIRNSRAFDCFCIAAPSQHNSNSSKPEQLWLIARLTFFPLSHRTFSGMSHCDEHPSENKFTQRPSAHPLALNIRLWQNSDNAHKRSVRIINTVEWFAD